VKRPAHREIKGVPRTVFTEGRILWLCIISAVVTACGFFLAPSVWDWWNERQARQLCQQAVQQLKKGDSPSAAALIFQAYQRKPADAEIVRTRAGILEKLPGGTEAAISLYQQLIENKKATATDRASLGKIFVRLARHVEARAVFGEIPPTDHHERPVLELESILLAYEGRVDEAKVKSRAAILAVPDDPANPFKLAVLDLDSSFREIQERGEKTLWDIAMSDSPQAVDSMLHLCRRPTLTRDRALAILDRTKTFLPADDPRRFEILSGAIKALPLKKESIIQGEVERQHSSECPSPAFLSWLAENGAFKTVLNMVSLEKAITVPALFPAYISAMEKGGLWAELQKLLRTRETLPISPLQRALVQAHCAAGLNAPAPEIRAYLDEAFNLPTGANTRNALLATANAADALGQVDLAIKALFRLAEHPQSRLATLDRILQIQHRSRDLRAVLSTLKRCLDERPGLSPYLETACYLRLLTGEEIEIAVAESKQLAENKTGSPDTLQLLSALAAYRLGDWQRVALELSDLKPAKLSPGQRAVLCGLLNTIGKKNEAFQLAEKIPATLLFEEEMTFLQRAL
jgi:hypothetical protein